MYQNASVQVLDFRQIKRGVLLNTPPQEPNL